MSLVGFKAQNHPQQAVRDDVDDRGTNAEFFAEMVERFGPFTVDVAAASHNAKCERYYTLADDGLAQSWSGERVWCNPPYSDIGAWVAKAWSEMRDNGCKAVVMLLPANRTEQRWWQEHVEPFRDMRVLDVFLTVKFLPSRMHFDHPDVIIGPKGNQPPFSCYLLIWGADPALGPAGTSTSSSEADHDR